MRAKKHRLVGLIFGSFALLSSFVTQAADSPKQEPSKPDTAEMRVSGLGWWKNRELRQTLHLLEPEEGRLATLDAAVIEDGVVLLQSALERDGFLHSTGVVRVRSSGASLGEFPWSAGDVPTLPRDLGADEAVFVIDPGVRYHFAQLAFTDLTVLDRTTARSYFVEEGFLFGGAGTHRFTPARLRNGVANLREQLVRMGHADAQVVVQAEERDDATGRVRVTIAVTEGPVHRVDEVTPPDDAPTEVGSRLRAICAEAGGAIDSPLWQQDFVQAARAICYDRGYANADVKLVAGGEPRRTGDGDVRQSFQLVVLPGPQVRVGAVKFVGDPHTHESLLQRTTKIEPGQLFVRGEVEQDRLHLGALGAFRSVQAVVDPVAPDRWDLTYQLRPAKQVETSLLLGYGSYEKLRGGIEVLHSNLLGQAHRGRLQLIHSQKSTYGDYLYTVPQIFGTSTDASLRVFGLERKEVSFDRRELGASIGARRHLDRIGADAALRYQFESVKAHVFDPNADVDVPTDSNVGSLTFDLTRDRLDNPIAPHRGYFLAVSLETAAREIGGQVNYQRLDWRVSWHRRIARGQYVHVGLRHGVAWPLSGSSSEDIPLAKRYFPGGEGTVRGFIEGRASPRAADGTFIGAQTSTVLNLEFEQSLAQNLSAIVFLDAGLTAARLADWPGDQQRVSLGLGLRYNTVIGPARLEFGHNIVRESGDGNNAVHLALGYPF